MSTSQLGWHRGSWGPEHRGVGRWRPPQRRWVQRTRFRQASRRDSGQYQCPGEPQLGDSASKAGGSEQRLGSPSNTRKPEGRVGRWRLEPTAGQDPVPSSQTPGKHAQVPAGVDFVHGIQCAMCSGAHVQRGCWTAALWPPCCLALSLVFSLLFPCPLSRPSGLLTAPRL